MFAIIGDSDKQVVDTMTSLLHEYATGYVEATGSWEGKKETSFILHDITTAMLVANETDQQAVLVVDDNDQAFLAYPGVTQLDHIGEWTELQQDKLSDCWTQIGNQYFGVK